jgi:universal stress protein A
MRFRPSETSGSLTVELRPDEKQFPAIPLPEIHLKKILVPIDFSDSSKKALAYAEALARQFQASVHLLHVQAMPTPVPMVMDFPIVDPEAARNAEKELRELASSLDASITRHMTVLPGRAEDEIVRAIEENNIDLVILGTHTRGALQHWLLGSMSERVLRNAFCPVLIVREKEHDFIDAKKPSSTPSD